MTKPVKITVRFPEELEMEFVKQVIADKYGMRGKSKWVSEAIDSFLGLEDFVEFVEYGEALEDVKMGKIQSFYLNDAIIEKINNSIVIARKQLPTLEGVKSLIIRSSVIHRLLRKT